MKDFLFFLLIITTKLNIVFGSIFPSSFGTIYLYKPSYPIHHHTDMIYVECRVDDYSACCNAATFKNVLIL